MRKIGAFPGILLILPVIISLFFVHNHLTVLSEDGAAYQLLAKSLWQGEGYRSIWEEGSPVHVHFPPALPLMLVPFEALFGESQLPIQLFMCLWYGLGCWLGYRLMRRRMSPLASAVWTTFIATSPLYLESVGAVNTEYPFVALALGGFLLLDDREEVSPGALAGAVLLFGLAFFTRTIGFVLLGAAALLFIIKPGIRGRLVKIAAPAAAAVILMFLWKLWTASGSGGRTYFQELFLLDPYAEVPVRVGAMDVLRRIGSNFLYYGSELTTLLAYESAVIRKISPAVFAAGAVGTLCVVMYGWWRWVKGRRSATPIYVLLYFGPILLWFWQYTRFVFPVLIPLGICFAEGLAGIGERIFGKDKRHRVERIITALGVLLVLGNLVGIVYDLRQPLPAPIADFYRLHEPIKASAKPGDIVVTRKAAVSSLLTGLRTRGVAGTKSNRNILENINGANWLILDDLDPEERASVLDVIDKHPERFKKVDTVGKSALYRIIPSGNL